MKRSNSWIILLFFLFSVSVSNAQSTVFNANGKLTHIDASKNIITTPVLTTLDNDSKEAKEKIIVILKSKIDDAIKKLNDPNDSTIKFLQEIWSNNEISSLKNDLQEISTNMDATTAYKFTGTVLKEMTDQLNTHILGNSPSIFSTPVPTSTKVTLVRKEAFNKFIIDYYNKTINSTIKNVNLSDLIRYTKFFLDGKTKADLLAKQIIDNNGVIKMKLFTSLHDFITILRANPDYNSSKKLLKDNWFQQWFWLKGGEVNLNPFDFSTDEFLTKFPKYDLEKGKIFDTYIDALINKYMQYDTFGRVDQFKKILSQRSTGNEMFEMTERQNKLEQYNKAKSSSLTTETILNQVEIPSKGNYYSYSALDGFDCTQNDKVYLTKSLETDKIKTLVVHNIPKDSKADFSISSVPIKDRSAIQESIDTIAGLIGDISKYSTAFGAFNDVITKIFDQSEYRNNDNIAPPSKNVTFTTVVSQGKGKPIPKVILKEYLTEILKNDTLFEQNVFDGVFPQKLNKTVPKKSLETDGDLIEQIKVFLSKYEEALKAFQVQTISDFEKEKTFLSGAYKLFSSATLPPKKLEEIKDKTPLYSSKILNTKNIDEPSKNIVNVFVVKNSTADTSKIDKFVFKTGKNYRFQISAGIAYTLSNFVQSTAKEENGKIVISNSSQQFRLSVGLHVHFGKGLFLQDNRFLGHFWDRSSAYIGVGIPKPLENVYLGYSYDFFPGLKTIAGVHIDRNDKYTIQNNAIIDKRTRYGIAGPFVAIQIDPVSLLKALNFISPKK